ncbi:MAG: HDOD domain-containing protein, partial [Phycisphaerales bacterium]|nr:HDOD domain-containing protein [Phycisphaerales bacterium]
AIARDIAEDQVLAAAVLRTVNSPFYRGVEKVSSVQRAVARLGTRTLRTLLMHQSLRGAIFDRRGAANRFAELLWRRSLASACIMRGLARFGRLDADEAYLLGLLHDIGSVIVLRIVRTEEKRGFADVDLDTFEYLCRQSHQEFGELIADAWKLPADIKSLIAAHHTHPLPDDPLRTERLMLILTDMIVAVLCFAPPGNYDLIQCRAARDLGLSGRLDYVDWLTMLPAEIDDFIAES